MTGKPTKEAKAREYASQRAFEVDQVEETLAGLQAAKVKEVFREGVKRLCVKRIWVRVEQECRNRLDAARATAESEPRRIPVGDMTDFLGLIRQQAYAFEAGQVGFDIFFVVMSALNWKYEDFDNPPSNPPSLVERVHAGYEAAIYWQVESTLKGKKKLPVLGRYLDQVSLGILLVLHSLPRYIELLEVRESFTDSDWSELANQIRRCVGTNVTDAPTLKKLDLRWGDALAKVQKAMPYQWVDEHEVLTHGDT